MTTEERIKWDGNNYGWLNYAKAVLQPAEEAEYIQAVSKNSYIAGATKEAERCKPLVEALEKIKGATNNSAIRIMVTKALRDYKK